MHRRSGTYAGVWTSDTLAEMFEGLVGALLLDCGYDYDIVKQQLLPWVASSLGASRQAGAASMLSTAAGLQPAAATLPDVVLTVQQPQQFPQSQQLQAALLQQLQETCGFDFSSCDPLKSASQHMMQVMISGACSAEAETLKFLGFSILQFTAALQAYRLQHQKGREPSTADRLWPAQLQEECWHPDSRAGSVGVAAGCSSSCAGHSYGAGHRCNVVQQMSEHAGELTTVRHR
jgi:dsRNA-specific ribonuclease